MPNWRDDGVRKGMSIPLNLTVTKVTERDGFRSIHLAADANSLPAGFELRDVVLRVPASTQAVTLAEANGE